MDDKRPVVPTYCFFQGCYDPDYEREIAKGKALCYEFNRLHPNDRKRIIRALEVYRLSGRPLSSFGNDFSGTAGRPMRYDALMIGLTMERALLYERIDARVDRMMEAGLLEDIRTAQPLRADRAFIRDQPRQHVQEGGLA